ncbi:alpha/beta hydrolase [Edaphobacter bradus]|uniref:alpha/beta hydrolase n=1 Tax=Edaphobacter bradus TaxID=2259016 RepID=UPI0021DF5137|nr:alpha/beta hydrolase-fold protein [Edaphobacter bradus]
MNTDSVRPEDQNALAATTVILESRLQKHLQFASQYMEEKHDLIAYLPPMYEAEQERRYPVLFMQDGQNLFDPKTAFIPGNHWRMGETADELIAADAIEPLIIVGIYNTGKRRIDEYTPTEDTRLGGGQADAYGRMLTEELRPFIERTYRTRPGAGNYGIGGSSLGGLVSLYLGLRYPTIFGRLAVMSPSVWWQNRAILKSVAGIDRKPDLRIWLDVGTCESRRAVPNARALERGLIRKGWQLGQDLAYTEAQGAEHNELAWAQRVAPMLRFLFPPE